MLRCIGLHDLGALHKPMRRPRQARAPTPPRVHHGLRIGSTEGPCGSATVCMGWLGDAVEQGANLPLALDRKRQLRFERADTLQGEVGVIASTFDAQLPEHIASSGKVFVAFDSLGFSGWDGRRQPFARDRATTRRGQPLAFGLPTACHSRARIPVEGGPRGPMACISAPSLGRLHLRRWQSRSFAQ